MAFRKFTADRVFDGERLLENTMLVTDDKGLIIGLQPVTEEDDVERFGGILSPGFINCHCHIELSHFKGCIPTGTGLVDFLINIVKNRRSFEGDKHTGIADADKEMWEGGISGVADICNTTDALEVKKRSPIRWHSLVEVINFYDENLERQIGGPQDVAEAHLQEGLPAVLVPHAPYSVSEKTMLEINSRTNGKIISIHNQEAAAENDLFIKGTGDFLRMYAEFGNGGSPFPVSGTSSLRTWLPRFTSGQTILVVHNTYIHEEDILFAKAHAERFGLQLVYCLCPNANRYIEANLPPVELLVKHDCSIVLGTDSYSSNWQLSIPAEMRTICAAFPEVDRATVLRWATSGAARALRWNDMGRFKKGCRPGIVLLNESFDSSKRIL
jgi:cytosine/adenosine deaminase-related metal-dependent hydrolase